MKKIITLMLVLALAGTMGTTAVFAAPVDDSVNTNDAGTARIVPEDDSYSKTDIEKILLRDGSDDENQTDKVLLKVNTYGDGQIAVTSDGMEPVFNDAAPLQSVAMNVDKGAAAKLKAKAKPASKKLKVKKHRAILFESSNSKVATVNKKGVIKAVGKGTCYVYAYAQNGVCKIIKVTVK